MMCQKLSHVKLGLLMLIFNCFPNGAISHFNLELATCSVTGILIYHPPVNASSWGSRERKLDVRALFLLYTRLFINYVPRYSVTHNLGLQI